VQYHLGYLFMNAYTVYKVLTHGSRQLLLVNDGLRISLCVYDEHTGQTLVRLCEPTIEEFTHALAVVKGEAS